MDSVVQQGEGTGASGGEEVRDLAELMLDEQLLFSDDTFPLLPEFLSSQPASPSGYPCFSASSSTSSSASSSWLLASAGAAAGSGDMQMAVPENTQPAGDPDVLDILDGIDILDTSFFSDESMIVETAAESQTAGIEADQFRSAADDISSLFGGSEGPSEELAGMFLDWLKSNKDTISPEDLRTIKIKKSTIESAVRRLGGDSKGKAQLVKLILTWVQNHHLQKKRRREDAAANQFTWVQNQQYQFTPVAIAPNPNTNLEYNFEAESNNPHWISYTDPSMMVTYANGSMVPVQFPGSNLVNCPIGWAAQQQMQVATAGPYSPTFQVPPTPQPLPASAVQQFASGFAAGQQMYNQGQCFAALTPAPVPAPTPTSATKEARLKRMARKRGSLTHYHQHSQLCHPHNNHQQLQQQQRQQIRRLHAAQSKAKASSSMATVARAAVARVSLAPPLPPIPPAEASPAKPHHNGAKRQVLKEDVKEDPNMKFLLQKVLKQSDVNCLGRIVLPKKEAENHLPDLDDRDGIALVMEDIGTSRVWEMRYRFWPNNKSRMYLLENTGEFVRLNGLQEGDFIVIYSDDKCKKYMIRGIKVRRSDSERAPARKKGITEKGGASRSKKMKSPLPVLLTIEDSEDETSPSTTENEAITSTKRRG